MSSPSRLYGTARYGSLIAAGVCTFLGLAILMSIVGVTWHSDYQYLRLDTYVFSPIADLVIWVIVFAFSTFPFYASVKRDRRALHDPLLTFSNLMLPVASIVMSLWSSKVAVAGFDDSGFTVAYAAHEKIPQLATNCQQRRFPNCGNCDSDVPRSTFSNLNLRDGHGRREDVAGSERRCNTQQGDSV